MNGRNWGDDMCIDGLKQSPINIDTRNVIQNNEVKFTMDIQSYDNLTLTMNDAEGKLYVDLSLYSRNNSLQFWDQVGEQFQYFLDGYQWKVPSEHTIDNRQYAAELQIIHKQFATRRKVIMTVLFDEEIFLRSNNQAKLKTCFVESFQFTNFKDKTNDLEIPMREFLQYIPQDFYFYEGSITQPPCTQQANWIVFKQPQVITTQQLNLLKSHIKLPKGNIREIQMIQGRRIYLGGSQQVKTGTMLR